MLTIELNKKEDRVEVYFDEDGLQILERAIHRLKRDGGHDHLMTPSWSGNELTEMKQGDHTTLINHVVLVFHGKDSS